MGETETSRGEKREQPKKGEKFSYTAEGARSRHYILSLKQKVTNTSHFENSKARNFLFKFTV